MHRCRHLLASGVDIDAALKAFSLGPDASLDQVKRRYRRLAVVTHPDRGGCAVKFARVRAEYEVLVKWLRPRADEDGTDDAAVHDFVKEVQAAVHSNNGESFRRMMDRALASHDLLRSTQLLHVMLEGGVLYHGLGMDHTVLCLEAITKWESATGMTASHEIFNSLITPYAFETSTAPADREMLFKCVTRICEEMQRRDVDVDANWWTKRLVINALVRDVHQLRRG